ncbi:MAG: class I SAM-dependent methyltransferase [Gordonia sp. (in: high G+C Gram-positive bacteria)]|uniref:class I SAM-dependent methyltransferase n=1 Tax=Gordonia sp. (in: high G+C Gram-positive bacteria) TaxID=84139 RepID=UPI0039E54344
MSSAPSLAAESLTPRWPDVDTIPAGPSAAVRGAIAARLFRRAGVRAGVHVVTPGSALPDDGPTMTIHRPSAFFRRLGTSGLIGLGESYMAGEWTADDLVGVLTDFADHAYDLVPRPLHRLRRLALPSQPSSEENTTANTRSNIARHYDLSNDLFAAFLDETMTYSGALFGADPVQREQARWDHLADAQRRKIERILDLAEVGPGTRLLEIGTGWGELCLRAAERGATVRSVTLSTEQRDFVRKRIDEAGRGDQITVDLLDYRSVDGEYDAIVSVEMIEAVGRSYWPAYFGTIDRLLAPGGRAAIQAITMPHDRLIESEPTQTWVHKYIFPGGQLTSLRGIGECLREHTSLRITGTSLRGSHYAETLRLWRVRFYANKDRVLRLGFDHTFLRMWEFYLAYCEAGFRSGYLDVAQLRLAR